MSSRWVGRGEVSGCGCMATALECRGGGYFIMQDTQTNTVEESIEPSGRQDLLNDKQ